ncbi:MAG: hypothetical protein HN344_05500, partial [Gammaproteobacteria bacterium]|nr:hypothetical protein [Gammaproteobacteria bacterium]
MTTIRPRIETFVALSITLLLTGCISLPSNEKAADRSSDYFSTHPMSALLSNDRAPAPFSGEETAPQKPVTSLPLSIDQEGKIPSYMSTHVAPPPKQFQQGGETVQLDYE